eukprot:gene18810-20706_t
MASTAEYSKVDENSERENENKIWIGNIDKRLTEYQLIQMLKQFGDIKKFEFLFHLHGPMKGEPRGYCFVEYENEQQSLKAIQLLNGKKVLSKSIIVDWAKPEENHDFSKKESKKAEPSKKLSRDIKIQMLEAKLALLDRGHASSSELRSNQRVNPREHAKPYIKKHKHK